MLMSFKQEFEKIKEQYNTGEHIRKQKALIDRLSQCPLAIFGCGGYGKRVYHTLSELGLEVCCFVDNFKTGHFQQTHIPIVSPQTVKDSYPDASIIIATLTPEKQIRAQLLSLGIAKEQILGFDVAYKLLQNLPEEKIQIGISDMYELLDQYESAFQLYPDESSRQILLNRMKTYLFREEFPAYEDIGEMYFPEQITFTDTEVFVDAGLFTGDTTELFIKKVAGKYEHIYGFEIDPKNLAMAQDNLDKYHNVTIVGQGLSDTTISAKANLGLGMGSNLNADAVDTVSLTSLNAFFKTLGETAKKPTFIKMDIEGAELAALRGAKEIISEYKPKLAIAAYHKPEDMYQLPLIIKEMNPDYKLMLRHYSRYMWETVLYAY